MKIWTDDESIELDERPSVADLSRAMRFKATHIKAKADPSLFEKVAEALDAFNSSSVFASWLLTFENSVFCTCSSCKIKMYRSFPVSKFCPHCGASMNGERVVNKDGKAWC